ncbi:pyridoxamine 5'-phosphate oxidase family protein, partial [Sphaerisporangium aureirubrum]
VGRVGFALADGPVVLPVNYVIHEGAVVFRTSFGGAMDDDLRTGAPGVEYKVAFEVDEVDPVGRTGWSVLLRGPVHHVDAEERERLGVPDVESWAGGERELFVRITPQEVTGRRIRRG